MQKTQPAGALTGASWRSSLALLVPEERLPLLYYPSSWLRGWTGRCVSCACVRRRCCATRRTCCICRNDNAFAGACAWSGGRRSCFCLRRSCGISGTPGPRAGRVFPAAVVVRVSAALGNLQSKKGRKWERCEFRWRQKCVWARTLFFFFRRALAKYTHSRK